MSHEADIRKAMGRFSQDTLDTLYSETFRKICSGEKHAREAAIGVFALLLCLREPISPEALLDAVLHINNRRGEEF